MPDRNALLAALAPVSANERHLELLERQLATPIGVLPFVGAGLSAPMGYPLWRGFLTGLAAEAGIEGEVRGHLDRGGYEEAAEILLERMGPRLFQDSFVHAFSDSRLEGQKIGGAARLLPSLGRGPVVTTNFDGVLERAFADAGAPFDHCVWGSRSDLAIRAIQQNEVFLLKLHGDYDDPADRVLTLSEYETHYGATDPERVDLERTLPRLLYLLIGSRPVLFLGCSLEKDRTVSILRRIAAEYPSSAHYAVVEQPAEAGPYHAKARFLSHQGIRPLWYRSGEHRMIELVLEHLAGLTPERGRAYSSPSSRQRGPAHNLPEPLTSFVGRGEEIAATLELLGSERLVVLWGPGGCGKTRLALEVARHALPSFPDGVWLVQLASLAEGALVPQAIAATLGLREQAPRPPTEILADHLRERQLLLVLDNCEHLVSDCASIASDLLARCPRLVVLATSREPLNVGETIRQVRPLALPAVDGSPDTGEVSSSESVVLFVDRARQVLGEFDLAGEVAGAVASICRRLDGIPLAIELAAAKLRHLSVREIAEGLDHRFALLTDGRRLALPQHQTLQATVDWSYESLGAEERWLFRRLSVFAGSFDRESAAEVCAPSDRAVMLQRLAQLVDKSLVDPVEQEGRRRLRLLETMRAYGRERLRDAGELAAAKAALLRWCLQLAQDEGKRLIGTEQAVAFARLERDHDNLRAAMRDCVERGDAAGGLLLASELWRFWEVRGYMAEGRERLAEVLALPRSEGHEPARARALSGAGMLAYRQGDLASAEADFRAALLLERGLGRRIGLSEALNNVGLIAQLRGDYATAVEEYRESLELCRHEMREGPNHEAERGIAVALFNLGNLALRTGDPAGARELLGESLERFTAGGSQRDGAFAACGIGLAALALGDLRLARERCAESLETRRSLGDKRGTADSLDALARIDFEAEGPGTACGRLRESLELRRAVSDRRGTAETLECTALLAQALDHHERAVRLLAAAEALREEIGIPLPPAPRTERDACLEKARDALGRSGFDQAWSRGRSASPEETFALAGKVTAACPLSGS